MSILQRCFDYLERHGVRYSHSIHPPARTALETADAERMPAHELAKNVVYRGDNGFGMAVLPVLEKSQDNAVKLLWRGGTSRVEAVLTDVDLECSFYIPRKKLLIAGKAHQTPVIADNGCWRRFQYCDSRSCQ